MFQLSFCETTLLKSSCKKTWKGPSTASETQGKSDQHYVILKACIVVSSIEDLLQFLVLGRWDILLHPWKIMKVIIQIMFQVCFVKMT